jgi:thiamine-monophosphate kinase
LDEFRLIEAIRRVVRGPGDPRVQIGIGDDAAVLAVRSGQIVATTDALVEGVHFRWDLCRPTDVGWKAAAVNLSDIAAMGARPLALLAAIEVPATLPDRDVVAAMRGLARAGAAHGASVVGGNVSAGPVFAMTVTALGEPVDGRVLRRAGARPGDVVLAGGFLGSGALGLDLLGTHPDWLRRFPTLARSYRRPAPQVDLGLRLATLGEVHALIDVSDGLVADLGHVLAASGVGALLDTARIPIHPEALRYARMSGQDALAAALSGGDDYRLLAVAGPSSVPLCESLGMTAIGAITARRGLAVLSGGKRVAVAGAGGWRHR